MVSIIDRSRVRFTSLATPLLLRAAFLADTSAVSVGRAALFYLLPMRIYETESGTKVRLKGHSVDVESVAPGVLEAVVDAARPSYAKRDSLHSFVVTSAHDGTHSEGSLHDDGLAIDLRVWGFTEAEAKRATAEIQGRLGERWDVVYEGTHIHVEYDPS